VISLVVGAVGRKILGPGGRDLAWSPHPNSVEPEQLIG
jgi:hypothetical protein